MPMYIGLYRLTEKGAAEIKKAPERIKASMKAWEAMGGKAPMIFATMGRYDYVTFGEAPNDEMATAFSAALASQGYVKTESMRAFTADEFGALLAKLP
jgi:uncharacterized protein with GYD domain